MISRDSLQSSIILEPFNPHVVDHFQKDIEALEQQIKTKTSDAQGYLHMGLAYSSKQLYSMAIQVYQRAITNGINDKEILFNLGRQYIETKQYEKAIDNFDRVLQVQPKDSDSLNWKGYCLKWLKRYDEALLNYDAALQSNPGNYEAYSNRGNTLRKMGRREQALECYKESIKLNANFPYAYNGMGNVFFESERLQEALEMFQMAFELMPTFANPMNGEGNVYRLQGKFEASMKCYDKALDLRPTFIYAWNGRGNVLIDLMRYTEAMTCYQKAIDIDPSYSNGFIGKGTTLKKLGQHFKALQCYTQAMQLDPYNLLAYCCRGSLLMNMDSNQAQEDLEEADRLLKSPRVFNHLSQLSVANTAETIQRLLNILHSKIKIENHMEENSYVSNPRHQKFTNDYMNLKEKSQRHINLKFLDKPQNNEIGRVSMNELVNDLSGIEEEYKKIMVELSKQGQQLGDQSRIIDIHEKKINQLIDITQVSGMTERSEVRSQIVSLKNEDINLHEYYRSFYWTTFNYFMAYKTISTGIVSSSNHEQMMGEKEKFIYKFSKLALDASTKAIPIISDIAGLVNSVIDYVYEGVRDIRFDNKVKIINRVLNLKAVTFEDLDLEISKAAINLTIRKKNAILDFKKQNIKEGLFAGIKAKLLGRQVDLYESDAAVLALQDVVAFLGYVYLHQDLILPSPSTQTDNLEINTGKFQDSQMNSISMINSVSMDEYKHFPYKDFIEELQDEVSKQKLYQLTLSELIEEIIMTQKADNLLSKNMNGAASKIMVPQNEKNCCILF